MFWKSRQGRQTMQPPAEKKHRRFCIDKLEERIAPHRGVDHGHGPGCFKGQWTGR